MQAVGGDGWENQRPRGNAEMHGYRPLISNQPQLSTLSRSPIFLARLVSASLGTLGDFVIIFAKKFGYLLSSQP
jgi:hypothetical protein